MEEARENTVPFNSVAERMEYMKEHDYYYNVLDEYSLEEVEEYITSLMVKTSSSNLIWQHLSSTKIMR